MTMTRTLMTKTKTRIKSPRKRKKVKVNKKEKNVKPNKNDKNQKKGKKDQKKGKKERDEEDETVSCGNTVCEAGTYCCNPSCGVCVLPGMSCTMQVCAQEPEVDRA